MNKNLSNQLKELETLQKSLLLHIIQNEHLLSSFKISTKNRMM